MRKLLAVALLVAAGACANPATDPGAAAQRTHWPAGTVVCWAPTEDSTIARCLEEGVFLPDEHYDYNDGAWRITDRQTAPTGRYLMRHPNLADEK